MTFTKGRQKTALGALIAAIVLFNVYRFVNEEKPKTAPLTYARGAVASSPVRRGLISKAADADPLSVFLERREEKFPGVARDIFRMENQAPRSKLTATTATAPPVEPPLPVEPEKTPEQIAEDLAREDLLKFRFLGYLTEKDNSLFLSKEGELFIVKSGDRIIKNYKIKETNKDYVILLDTLTSVEVRVELSGNEQTPETPPMPQQPLRQRPQPPQRPPQPRTR